MVNISSKDAKVYVTMETGQLVLDQYQTNQHN